MQWSNDGITVMGHDKFTITSLSSKIFSFPAQPRYVRVVYKNDGIAQTVFNL